MPPPSRPRRLTSRRILAWGAGIAAALLLGLWVDGPAYDAATSFAARHEARIRYWSWAWHTMGFVPFWLLVAAAFALVDRDRRRRGLAVPRPSRAVLLTVSVLAAGVAAEAAKLVLRRERPPLENGLYTFRSFLDEPLKGNGLGLPSSHTAVAFAAAWILWRLAPPTGPLLAFMACGCAASRVLAGKHFVSDVLVGALVGVACAGLVWERMQRAAEPQG